MNDNFKDQLAEVIEFYHQYKNQWNSYNASDEFSISENEKNVLKQLYERLKLSYPFFHPHYAGQMLKPPTSIASLAYLATMLINPNNHALDGGPVTSELENEVVDDIASMFCYKKYLGHLTSSGTIANLEGLWISKQLNPKKKFAICQNAHYTHTRLSNVLDFDYILIQMDNRGKMDLDHLEKKLKQKNIGTVVVTLGTTGFGAVDQLDEILKLRNRYNFRIHVDAAYGGFFKIIVNKNSSLIDNKPWKVISKADSIVVDPHKHGLQPYGCGCILFKDPSVGKFYQHDSPYTYFTSKDLHLGEVSLECSRAGASAAALWATLKAYPLNSEKGIFSVLISSRKAALKFYELSKNENNLRLIFKPELDIVNYFPNKKTTKDISDWSEKIFYTLMNRKTNPIYLSKYRVDSKFITSVHPEIRINTNSTTILRSVFMKKEHEIYVDEIFNEINELTV